MIKVKKEKRIGICIVIAAVCMIGMLKLIPAVTVFAETPTPSFTSSKKTLYVGGKTYKAGFKNLKKDAVITYVSENSDVASVSQTGVITPKKAGKVKIKAKIKQNGKNYSTYIMVTVKKVKIYSSLQYGTKKIDKCYLNTECSFDFFINLDTVFYKWSLSNEDIIEVTDSYTENGALNVFFKAKKTGTVVITVQETYTTGITYQKTIRVVGPDEPKKYQGELVYYGSYPQSEVTGNELTEDIIKGEYLDGVAEVNGLRYKRLHFRDIYYSKDYSYPWDWDMEYDRDIWHYFRYEPVAWRILSEKDGTLLLLSDKVIDVGKYYEASNPVLVTWAESTLRPQLNKEFLEEAFTKEEQKDILTTALKNKDTTFIYNYSIVEEKASFKSGKFGKGGKDTKDKVFLLSLEDILNPEYWPGMKLDTKKGERGYPLESRSAYLTTYALFNGGMINQETLYGSWFLRSPGDNNYDVSGIGPDGGVGSYADAWMTHTGVRPAIRIKRSDIAH